MKRLALGICLAVLALGCSDGPTTAGNGNPLSGAIRVVSGTVSVSGSDMTIIMTTTSCEDSILVTEKDTSVQTFIVSGNTAIVNDGSENS
ncbi:MAG: hypothetical protein MUF22_07215 [Chitinispirillaceae bacterium]|nr:hypothetical protein [Chitinispirillaceae bacterium]